MDTVITDSFRQTVLQEALKIFRAQGIHGLGENELSKKLGISTSTINHLAPTKEDLFRQAVMMDIEEQHAEREKIINSGKNPLEQLMTLLKSGLDRSKDVSPEYMKDLMSFPWIHDVIYRELEEFIKPMYHQILNEGIRQGLFRQDINLSIVTQVIIQNLNMLMNPQVFPPDQFSIGEVMRSIYLYYFRGLCTSESASTVDVYFADAY